jgi:hypothetical protein
VNYGDAAKFERMGDAETDSANKEQFDKQALPLIAF